MEPAEASPSTFCAQKIAQVNDGENSGSGGAATPGKLRVVRVKRKREQAPIENLWLEVSDPPSKRHEPDISRLSLSTAEATALPSSNVDTTTPSKLLFRRLETVSPSNSQTEASLYETLLQKVKERKHAHENRKEPRDTRAKSKAHDKQKQDQLLAAARIQHEAVAKRARFEQVWRSRRDGAKASVEGADSDPMRELFQLYDVVRIDEESAETIEKREKAKRDAELAQAALLANYLPLLRDCMPEAAADIEKDLSSRNLLVETDDYVYDVYAMDEGFSDRESEDEEFYPTIQIVETEGLEWGEPAESDYDSEDSNDENNPLNDYPDEDDFGDFEDQKSDKDSDETDFDIVGSDSGSDYDTVAIDNEQELRWGRRL